VVTVVEDTGRGSYLCMYDIPPEDGRSLLRMTKDQIHEAKKIEFNKNFLIKFGEEHKWKTQD
jgi:hypothetical protein